MSPREGEAGGEEQRLSHLANARERWAKATTVDLVGHDGASR
jgi:hypothetical protein